jgi:hypothetical protein
MFGFCFRFLFSLRLERYPSGYEVGIDFDVAISLTRGAELIRSHVVATDRECVDINSIFSNTD